MEVTVSCSTVQGSPTILQKHNASIAQFCLVILLHSYNCQYKLLCTHLSSLIHTATILSNHQPQQRKVANPCCTHHSSLSTLQEKNKYQNTKLRPTVPQTVLVELTWSFCIADMLYLSISSSTTSLCPCFAPKCTAVLPHCRQKYINLRKPLLRTCYGTLRNPAHK